MSYTEVLHQLTDLDRLTHLQAGFKAGIFSSWDRNGRERWGANGDAGQYLRLEPDGEAVMMELDGPGVIYRTWSANPMGKIRIYLDGAQVPTFEWNFPDLFDGKTAPFIKPLVYRRDAAQSASDCYLPIPFSKRIKITADNAHGQYYHFNYVLFPKEQNVESFHLPLRTEEQAALVAAAEIWSQPGRDPKPRLARQATISKKVVLEPGQVVSLCRLDQPGVIRAVRARVNSDQRYAWRKLVLESRWDGANWPQVLTPLGPFFAFDWEPAEYGSVIAGCQRGSAYQYFPMPFRKSAEFSLKSYLETSAAVEMEIEWAPLTEVPADLVYFFARWRHEPDSMTFDYPFIETAGRGHFVGVSMPIDHPLAGWWGEGDEKVWVDEDQFPPYIGTGSEDYFGDAWGIRYLSGPSFGASSMKGHRTCNYRWHFMDLIPFTKRMRMTIENYGPNGGGPRGQYDYSSTAFWYQSELTPPFEQVRGAQYIGADDPEAKPSTKEYSTNAFPDITAESLRTYGLGITFARQAEVLLADTVKAGRARVVTDALRKYEFDREQAVDFGEVSPGQTLGSFKITADTDSVYQARLYTAAEQGIADISLALGGKTLPVLSKPQPNVLQLGGVFLRKGEQTATLVAASSGRAIFDCIQLEPAPRVADAIEAEELKVVGTTFNAPKPVASDPVAGASAGRVLKFDAGKPGAGMILELGNRPKLPYALGVRPVLGPKAPMIAAFASGKLISPHFDLYAPEVTLGSAVLPLGAVPADATQIEIRAVDQNEKSGGYEIELDYFRWEPEILGPGTADGIWARVLQTHGCEYRAQDLGPAYSGGHHFWVQPSSLNAWVDIGVQIREKRAYEIMVRYTKSWDYAKVQCFLDGKPFGPVVDTYSATVVPAEPLTLGKVELDASQHILRFQAVGQNPESKGYLMGIDHVIVR